MQPKFSFAAVLGGVVMFAAVVAADWVIAGLPNRKAQRPAMATLALEPIEVPAAELAPLALVGAWQLTSTDPRFGGVSGIAFDGDDIVAITDNGVVLRFPKAFAAQMQVRITDLPDGPGDERFKINRDSEAIVRDARDRGWWVAFENRDQLWLFDERFERAAGRVRVPRRALGENVGVEGLALGGEGLLAFPENGRSVLVRTGNGWSQHPLEGGRSVADAVRIGAGSVLLVERDLTLAGFRNGIALVRPDAGNFRTLWRKRLPLGPRDNVEAVAAEPLPGGGYRVWLVSDDNFHPRMRTVLLVVDLPAAALPKRR